MTLRLRGKDYKRKVCNRLFEILRWNNLWISELSEHAERNVCLEWIKVIYKLVVVFSTAK